MKRAFISLLLISSLLLLSGCWDQVELNKRSYVLSIAIDEFNENKANITSITDPKAPKYNFLFEIALLKQAEENGGNHNRFLITVGTHSFPQALDILETTVEHPAILTHVLAIIISEEVARKGVIEISDFLVRNPDTRRNTSVFITPDLASNIIDFQPQISDTVGEFLGELILNAEATSLVLTDNDLGVISYNLANHLDFLLPRLIIENNRLVSKGAAVLNKNGKLIGWLDDEQSIEGTRIIRGLFSRGNVSVKCSLTNSVIIVRLRNVKVKIKTKKDMSVSMDVNVSGNIATNLGGSVPLTKDYLSKINRDVESSIQDKIEKALAYFQQDIQADVFFFGLQFKQYHYKEWKEHKDNWLDTFTDIEVEINVNSKIENIGNIKALR